MKSHNHWAQAIVLEWAENSVTFLGGVGEEPGMANLIEGDMLMLPVLVILEEEVEC